MVSMNSVRMIIVWTFYSEPWNVKRHHMMFLNSTVVPFIMVGVVEYSGKVKILRTLLLRQKSNFSFEINFVYNPGLLSIYTLSHHSLVFWGKLDIVILGHLVKIVWILLLFMNVAHLNKINQPLFSSISQWKKSCMNLFIGKLASLALMQKSKNKDIQMQFPKAPFLFRKKK